MPDAGEHVAVAAAAPRRLFSIRTRDGDGLPARIGTSARYGDGSALCLGPDEWLAVTGVDAASPVVAAPSSVTEVSDRSIGVAVTGEGAARLLMSGCPLDLDVRAFPVGKATRTLYETVEIILWRTTDHAFHVEVWRSFHPYLMLSLETAASRPDDQLREPR